MTDWPGDSLNVIDDEKISSPRLKGKFIRNRGLWAILKVFGFFSGLTQSWLISNHDDFNCCFSFFMVKLPLSQLFVPKIWGLYLSMLRKKEPRLASPRWKWISRGSVMIKAGFRFKGTLALMCLKIVNRFDDLGDCHGVVDVINNICSRFISFRSFIQGRLANRRRMNISHFVFEIG